MVTCLSCSSWAGAGDVEVGGTMTGTVTPASRSRAGRASPMLADRDFALRGGLDPGVLRPFDCERLFECVSTGVESGTSIVVLAEKTTDIGGTFESGGVFNNFFG